uniref:SDR family NAD(P)-dependent oxidoreductase n=1 Tax=Photobacterium sanctipauli TaxID=1342794 RepID=UPI00055F3E52
MKTVLVTGGSKGIGLEAVKAFVSQGHQVVTCARSVETWQEAVRSSPELEHVDFVSVDLSDSAQVEKLFSHIKQHYQCLHIAINNASPKLESGGVFANVDTDELHKTLMNDFWAHALCFK